MFVKKNIVNILNLYYKNILLKYPGIYISQKSRINYHKIRYKSNSKLTIEDGCIMDCDVFFEKENAELHIGNNTFIGGSRLLCSKKIMIGNDVLISFDTTIVDHDSHSIFFKHRKNDVTNWFQNKKDWTHVNRQPVIIKDKAWIGMHSIILKGVTIGEGAIVGAGSVVTSDVPPWTIVAGNPARIIRELSEDER